jgi:hypothetical protein
MIESELHGDMQRPAEMTGLLIRCGLAITEIDEVVGTRVVPWVRDSYWDRRILQLRQIPVRYPIVSVFEYADAWTVPGGFWPANTQLVDGTDYQLDQRDATFSWTGHLLRRTGTWATFLERSVKVTYTAGFTPAELSATFPKVRLATIHAIIKSFNELKAQQPDNVSRGGGVGGIVSEGIENWNASYGASVDANFNLVQDLPLSCKRMLADYVRYTKFV